MADATFLGGRAIMEPLEARLLLDGGPWPQTVFEDFEAGSVEALGDAWTFEAPSGSIAVVSTLFAHSGCALALSEELGGEEPGRYQDAVLHVDLAGATGVTLDFYLTMGWLIGVMPGGESYSPLACASLAVSVDGQTWTQAAEFTAFSGCEHFGLDLDALGLTYSDDVRIRFRHYGEWVGSLYLDDVRVDRLLDVTGPSIVSMTPSGGVSGPVAGVDVTFSEPVDPASFTAGDVSVVGPLGQAVALDPATPIADSGDGQTFHIQFETPVPVLPPAGVPGVCQVAIGPDVLDLAGNSMDSDGDGLQNDGYTGELELEATPAALPIFEGFEGGNIEALGDSWSFECAGPTVAVRSTNARTGSGALDMFGGSGAYQDAILHADLAGQTGVTLDLWVQEYTDPSDPPLYPPLFPPGSHTRSWGSVAVSVDGESWTDLVAIDGRDEYRHVGLDLDSLGLTYTDDVQIRLRHGDPSLWNWLIIGERSGGFAWDDVRLAQGLDVTGPAVVAMDPSGEVPGPVPAVDVTFSEPIDPATFTAADVTVTGRAGAAVALDAAEPITDSGDHQTFTVHLAAPAALAGAYDLAIGPDVSDPAGNALDQDGDGLQDDVFHGPFAVSAVPAPLPIVEDFEAGSVDALGAHWSFAGDGGSIEVSGGCPHGGTWALATIGGSTYTDTQDAILHADLAGATDVTLEFHVYGDYTSGSVAVSVDGETWTDLVLLEGSETYRRGGFDLDALGLTYTDDVRIRFSHTGLSGIFSWDDIRLDVGLDVIGPSVTAMSPTGEVAGPVAAVDVTFSEPIDPASFSADDVTITDPGGGAVALDGAEPITDSGDGQTFTIHLAAAASVAGAYDVAIGPDVADAAGNTIDQDGDGLQGDVFGGQFTPPATPAALPIVEDFEAGTLDGLGGFWSFARDGGSIAVSGDRPHGGSWALEMIGLDGTLENPQDAILHADLTGATGVALWFSVLEYDGSSGSGSVAVSADGETWTDLVEIDGAEAYQRYALSLDALGLAYSDDVRIRFRHVGYYAGFAWDDIRLAVGADITGPSVTAISPSGEVPGPVAAVDVTFSEPIDPASFTADDVTVASPGGTAIALDGTEPITDSGDHQTFTIHLAGPASVAGVYDVALGPDVSDPSGNLLDADGDGLQGDVFHGPFAVTASPTALPVIEGFEAGAVEALGPAWQLVREDGTIALSGEHTHGGTAALAMTSGEWSAGRPDAVLHVDLAGATDVWLEFHVLEYDGDGSSGSVAVSVDGQTWTLLALIDGAGEYERYALDLDALGLTYTDDVRIRFRMDGYDSGFAWDDIHLAEGLDIIGPSVTAISPSGEVPGPVAAVDVTFSEPIDPASFTAADVSLTGPLGLAVPLDAVEPITDSGDHQTFTIHLAEPVGIAGAYGVAIGPNLADPAGNAMDQDGDGLAGDGYAGEFILSAIPAALPIVEDFEAGSIEALGNHWSFARDGGTIEVASGDAYAGTWALEMDGNSNNSQTQDAILHADLTGATGVTLDFFIREMGVDSSASVAVSVDGGAWTDLMNIDRTDWYRHVGIDLDALGLAYTDDVRFRFRRTGMWATFAWDDIRLLAGGTDVTGPSVVSVCPVPVGETATGLDVTFSEPIDAASFTAADVTITDPLGEPVDLDAAQPIVDSGDHQTFTVHFAAPLALVGTYEIVVGPDVLDPAGNAMDQNGDGLQYDVHEGTWTLDVVPATPPIEEGFEAGSLEALGRAWTFTRSDGQGLGISVFPANAHTGSCSLLLSIGGELLESTSSCEAVLHADLAGRGGVVLEFWAKKACEATGQTSASVSIDGAPAVPVVTVDAFDYQPYRIELDDLASSYGEVKVRFRETRTVLMGGWWVYTSGSAWDDVRLVDVGPAVEAFEIDDGLGTPADCHTLSFAFSERTNVPAYALSIRDAAGALVPLPEDVSFSYQGATRTARWDLASLELPAGHYTAVLDDEWVRDLAGNELDGDEDGASGGDYEMPFTVALRGDATRDDTVDFRDYLAWKAHAGTGDGATWDDGDFDGDGAVGRGDLALLVANMGRSVPEAAPAGSQADDPPPADAANTSAGETTESAPADASPPAAGTAAGNVADTRVDEVLVAAIAPVRADALLAAAARAPAEEAVLTPAGYDPGDESPADEAPGETDPLDVLGLARLLPLS